MKAYRRAVFKSVRPIADELDHPSRNQGGFWIQGGKLALFLGGCDYSGVQVDVCFLPSDRVEWYTVTA